MAGGRLLNRGVAKAIVLRSLVAVVLLGLFAPSSHAFEFFNGRVAANGYFESTFRAMNRDYSEDWDATQWYMIFNLELELDLVQDTAGPIDLLSAFVRAEVLRASDHPSPSRHRLCARLDESADSVPRRITVRIRVL